MLALDKSCLILKDRESLLQTLNFGCSACCAFLISLRLCHTAILDLGVILFNRSKLGGGSVLVTCELGDALVKAFELLGFVLDVLFLRGLGDFVLLRLCVILRLGI